MSLAAAVAFTVLMIGTIGAAGVHSGEMLAALVDPSCTASACRPVGLAVVGWAVVGGPLLLAGLVVLVFPPGTAAQYAMLACVGLMAVGFTIVYAGFGELQSARPDVGPLGVGSTAAVLALVLGGAIGGPAHLTGWERPRYSSTARLPSAVGPLLAVGVCEVLALVGVLLWTTLVR